MSLFFLSVLRILDICACRYTAQKSKFRNSILVLDNTKYFVHVYWLYCSILSILRFHTGHTGFAFVLSIVARARPPSAVAGWKITTGYMRGGCVLVCMPHVLFPLFSRLGPGLAAVVGAYNVLKWEIAINNIHVLMSSYWRLFLPVRYCFLFFSRFLSFWSSFVSELGTFLLFSSSSPMHVAGPTASRYWCPNIDALSPFLPLSLFIVNFFLSFIWHQN